MLFDRLWLTTCLNVNLGAHISELAAFFLYSFIITDFPDC